MDEKLKKRLEPFQFTKPSREEKRFRRQQWLMWIFFLVYVGVLGLVIYYQFFVSGNWKFPLKFLDDNSNVPGSVVVRAYMQLCFIKFEIPSPIAGQTQEPKPTQYRQCNEQQLGI